MTSDPRQVTIHLARLGKPERSYSEGFVEDNGICLKTFSIVPEDIGRKLSEKFQRQGWILPGRVIHAVAKYHFYNEFFNIVEYQDSRQEILGYYCDIVTRLQRKGNEYFLTDLILDVWINPDGQVIELDRDEFEAAISTGLMPPHVEERALAAVGRLKSEVAAGIFPAHYLS
jgi:predicted RNA-binding protein associated with RNAse of E/G family